MQLCHVHDTPLTGTVLSAYRHFVGSLGANGAYDALAPQSRIDRAISSIAPIDRFYVSEREDLTKSPNLIAHRLEGVLAHGMTDYLERYFRRDPVGQAIQAAAEEGVAMVLRVGPQDIAETEYRHRFFEEPSIVERLSVVQRISDRWLIMNVARRAPLPRFTDEEVDSFASLSQLLLPLAAQQAKVQSAVIRPQILGVEELEERFADHCPLLSVRERQVCARTVVGMTSEATALDLGIGIGSVQTYRKRAFQRLGICSAFQLAPLVMH